MKYSNNKNNDIIKAEHHHLMKLRYVQKSKINILKIKEINTSNNIP